MSRLPHLILCCFLCAMTLPDTLCGQARTWTSVGPDGGGSVRTLALDPKSPATIYAGTPADGIFKSSDGGTSWTAVNTGLASDLSTSIPSVQTLAIDPVSPATLYAGASVTVGSVMNRKTYGGVFRSNNGGNNWTAVNSGLPNLAVTVLAVDPKAPSTVYAAGSFNGVF
jgi:hypothetical protein